jgi:hypothetical protein
MHRRPPGRFTMSNNMSGSQRNAPLLVLGLRTHLHAPRLQLDRINQLTKFPANREIYRELQESFALAVLTATPPQPTRGIATWCYRVIRNCTVTSSSSVPISLVNSRLTRSASAVTRSPFELGTKASGTSRCHCDNSINPWCVALPRLTGSSATKIGAFGEKLGFRFSRAASSSSKALMMAAGVNPSTSAQFGRSGRRLDRRRFQSCQRPDQSLRETFPRSRGGPARHGGRGLCRQTGRARTTG